MDGNSGTVANRVATPRRKRLKVKGKSAPELHDIFVRAHTSSNKKAKSERGQVRNWPAFCLIIDTETTIDPAQKLNFGVYRRCKLVGRRYLSVAEGIFHKDQVSEAEMKLLKRFQSNPPTLAAAEHFPAPTELKLMSRAEFIEKIFWRSVKNQELIVSFNAPFDLSRLAFTANAGKAHSNWSLAFSPPWTNPKTGRRGPNPNRPRIVIDSQNSKMAFINLRSVFFEEDKWPRESHFLDLRTLGWALRNESFSLERACHAFHVKGKKDHDLSGKITREELEYCRGDVAATHRLLNAMMEEFRRNPIHLRPDKSYSPASIAKAYLDEMGIKHPKQKFKVPAKVLGVAMQGYYGGRAECRIRRTPVPVIHTDFTSQYPTVNALLGNWNVLTASSIRFTNYTARARELLLRASLEQVFEKEFWKDMSFFALVKPNEDILPVRTVYESGGNKRTQNIGLNYLASKQPIWYAGPDLIASKILTGKPPTILKAIQMVPGRPQKGLEATNLGGMVEIDPREGDFYRKVVEQRNLRKETDESLSDFLKVLANSGSYGLFVEVNVERKKKEKVIRYFSGNRKGQVSSNYVEMPGAWYYPPLASLITSGGRLLLAMLEKSVQERGGSYLFCDTDSLCIVGTENGGFVECDGGPVTRNGKSGIVALSLEEVQSIVASFRKLNPYDPNAVSEILKIEKVNYVGCKPKNGFRQLFGYAVSAKRYALYSQTESGICIEKASGHGLGYLLGPKARRKRDKVEETPRWILEAWEFLLRRELKLPPNEPHWLDRPAMMLMVVTTPNIFKHRRPDWLGPFNFFLFPILSKDFGGYPKGFDKSNFVFITPYESDRRKWASLVGINLCDNQAYQIAPGPVLYQDRVVPESFRILLQKYLGKSEPKSRAPDGNLCGSETRGLLQRSRIEAGSVIPVGKETDRHWEQGDDPSMIDFEIHIFEERGKLAIASPSDRKKWSALGLRRLMRESKLSQSPVSRALKGEPVRLRTLSIIRQVADRLAEHSI
jgi:hypothetical protein